MTDNQIGMGLTDNIIEPDEKAAEQMQQELVSLQKRLADMPVGRDELSRFRLQLDIATHLVAMDQKNDAWQMAVTFPVDPTLSVNMLDHVIEETPNDSDGGAVAAAAAHYLADLRASDEKQRDSLGFLTGNLLASVAYRHSGYKDREMIDMWVERLELNQPEKFLPRLGMMLDVIVGDNWWIDRDALRNVLPEDAGSY
jgi:hypothetical protein